VTITGADIEPFARSGIPLRDGESYRFVVTRISESVHDVAGIALVTVPAGSFRMGEEGVAEPVREVSVSAFEMGVYEITQGRYRAATGMNPARFDGEDALPVERVTWWDAIAFCNALSAEAGLQPCYDDSTGECDFTRDGFRLPTEAEWEYACRAGTITSYSSGDTEADRARAGWFGDTSGGKPHAVGGKAPNAWGLYDLPGNVWEWCHDRYGDYSPGDLADPSGAHEGRSRVIRGGGWGSADRLHGRSAFRYDYYPEDGDGYIGFRVVRSAAPRGE
jgi:formylglycine-generating enzyme required for sulfatase activity